MPTTKKVDTFLAVLCLAAETLRVSAFLGCGLYSLAMLAQPDLRTGPSFYLEALSLFVSGPLRGPQSRPLIPAIIRVILGRRWY